MNVEEFKSSFQDMARMNRFRCYIPGLFGADRTFEFLCKGAQLPGAQMGMIDATYNGRKIKLQGDRDYADWTITVYQDVGNTTRAAFNQWMTLMNQEVENVGIGAHQGYKKEATLEQLAQTGDVLATYTIYGMFPTDVAAVELGWDQNDAPVEFGVTFAYDYWMEGTNTTTSSPVT